MALAAPVAPSPGAQSGTQPSGQGAAQSNETLLAENTAAAAASAVGSLVRALAGEQQPSGTAPATHALRAGGPPVDQIVRDLLRPQVKGWMDQLLPDLVERLVRAEVRRIVGNAG
jgi:cell pole-organizing protein PopZ